MEGIHEPLSQESRILLPMLLAIYITGCALMDISLVNFNLQMGTLIIGSRLNDLLIIISPFIYSSYRAHELNKSSSTLISEL